MLHQNIRIVNDQKLVIRNLWKGKACEMFFQIFSSVLLWKTIAFSFITFWWLLRSFFIMIDYDYLVRLRFTLRKKVLNDNDSVNKVHTFEQKSVTLFPYTTLNLFHYLKQGFILKNQNSKLLKPKPENVFEANVICFSLFCKQQIWSLFWLI